MTITNEKGMVVANEATMTFDALVERDLYWNNLLDFMEYHYANSVEM